MATRVINSGDSSMNGVKAAVKQLQEISVPNTRKINGVTLDQDVEIVNTLTVNLTQSGSTYTADKTFDEIKAAYDAGKSIHCRSGNITTDLYTLTTSPDYILFSSHNGYTVGSRVVYANGSWDVGLEYFVPTTRKINGKNLATDIELSYDDLADKPEVVQSDWQENDSTAASYVKNRMGGYDVPISNTVFEGTIPETTEDSATTKISGPSYYQASGELTTQNLLIEGATATIVWGGTTYTDTVKSFVKGDTSFTYVGADIQSMSFDDFPFFFATTEESRGKKSARYASGSTTTVYAYICAIPTEPESPISVTITQSGVVPVKIAEKYLDLTTVNTQLSTLNDDVDNLYSQTSNALNAASNATSTANTAKSTAETAKTTAETAKTTADAAKATANAAISNPSMKSNGQFLSYNGNSWVSKTLTSDVVGSLSEDTILLYKDIEIAVSLWETNVNPQASESEKNDFPYMAQISLSNVSSDDLAIVSFKYDDLISDNFSPIAYTTNSRVVIEAHSIPVDVITLSSVVIIKTKPAVNAVLFKSPNEFTLSNSGAAWDGIIETSINGEIWNTWDGTGSISSSNGKLYLRGKNNTGLGSSKTSKGLKLIGSNIEISGSILALIDYRYQTLKAGYEFAHLFTNNTSIVKADKLLLPSTTLNRNCYYDMFSYCTSLMSAPKLPATNLASQCYENMFKGCTSLTTLPELPATTLNDYCYFHMFYGCSGIKLSTTQNDSYQTPYRIPSTGDGTAQSHSLDNMFANTGGTFTGTPEINTTYYLAT